MCAVHPSTCKQRKANQACGCLAAPCRRRYSAVDPAVAFWAPPPSHAGSTAWAASKMGAICPPSAVSSAATPAWGRQQQQQRVFQGKKRASMHGRAHKPPSALQCLLFGGTPAAAPTRAMGFQLQPFGSSVSARQVQKLPPTSTATRDVSRGPCNRTPTQGAAPAGTHPMCPTQRRLAACRTLTRQHAGRAHSVVDGLGQQP